jgi:hypothetical protein
MVLRLYYLSPKWRASWYIITAILLYVFINCYDITSECLYNTTWKGAHHATPGGKSSNEEMCIAFIQYYPRDDSISQCGSFVAKDSILSFFGIDSVKEYVFTYIPIITNILLNYLRFKFLGTPMSSIQLLHHRQEWMECHLEALWKSSNGQ